MTISTPRHQKLRPSLTARVVPAAMSRRGIALGGVAVAAPATVGGAFAQHAEAATLATASVKATAPASVQTAVRATPTTSNVTVLSYGSTGSLVRTLQQRLGGIAVDGSFGPATRTKVLAFQRSKGLAVDGYVGPATWAALGGFPGSGGGSEGSDTTPTPADPTLKYGATGAKVQELQRLLKISVDGSFGPATRTAVRTYQSNNGLPVTGVVDSATWTKLRANPVTSDPGDGDSGDSTTLRYGATGAKVKELQRMLAISIDGSFGPATLAAVRTYQGNNGLPVTGVVDSVTWLKLTTNPVVSNPGGSTALNQAVINEAKKYLGVPYVWGGATPSGFDCSGLIEYVYKQLGKTVPRVAGAQQDFFTPVSSPQPGDLVFFGDPAHHVGIWLGPNQMLAAPYPGQVVRIQPIYNTPSGYGRFPG